jgi:hypothetical protein
MDEHRDAEQEDEKAQRWTVNRRRLAKRTPGFGEDI